MIHSNELATEFPRADPDSHERGTRVGYLTTSVGGLKGSRGRIHGLPDPTVAWFNDFAEGEWSRAKSMNRRLVCCRTTSRVPRSSNRRFATTYPAPFRSPRPS